MFDTEREHWDHEMGCMTEHQNAYALSNMEHNYRAEEIDDALNEGKFVLVLNNPVQCMLTDAYLKQPSQSLFGSYDSLEDAQAARQAECEACEYDDESWLTIEPHQKAMHVAATVSDDSIPF